MCLISFGKCWFHTCRVFNIQLAYIILRLYNIGCVLKDRDYINCVCIRIIMPETIIYIRPHMSKLDGWSKVGSSSPSKQRPAVRLWCTSNERLYIIYILLYSYISSHHVMSCNIRLWWTCENRIVSLYFIGTGRMIIITWWRLMYIYFSCF